MLSYILRRMALIVPTFLGITILIFAITRFVPGGPVERMLASMHSGGDTATVSVAGNNSALSEEQMAELNAFYGLDKPVLEAYWDWLTRLLVFDFGESTRYYEPVSTMIAERLPVSLFYGGMTFFISYFISIPLGYYKAIKHGSVFDSASSVMIFVGYALPGYVVGVFLITVFAYNLEWLPMGGFVGDDFEDYDTFWLQLKDVMWHAVLPLICYLIGDFATLTMTMKNSLMENLSSDYIRTAISKGLPFKKAVKKHALQNSLIPIASHFGNSLLFFMTGSFLIEVIFNIDGIGLLGYESIIERDYPVVMGIVAINAVMLMIGNILSDLCVALTDPRVRFGA